MTYAENTTNIPLYGWLMFFFGYHALALAAAGIQMLVQKVKR